MQWWVPIRYEIGKARRELPTIFPPRVFARLVLATLAIVFAASYFLPKALPDLEVEWVFGGGVGIGIGVEIPFVLSMPIPMPTPTPMVPSPYCEFQRTANKAVANEDNRFCCCFLQLIMLHFDSQEEEAIMPAIKPISELRNYNTVLREVTADTPVFLTKNGHGRFAIVDIRAYERLHTELQLMSALAEGEESARKCGWVSMDSAMKKLGV